MFSLEFIENTLSLIIRLSLPLVLVALSSTLSELSGIISLGTEGFMLIGAFLGAFGSYITGNAVLGMVIGVVGTSIFGFIFSVLCVKYKANQTVCGVGLNLFALGLTSFLTFLVWNQEGSSVRVEQVPMINIPILNKIPILNILFKNRSLIFYLTLIICIIIYYVVNKTKYGLRLKGISEKPLAVRSVGVDTYKYRYVCLIISGALAGLGGVYLSISANSLFVNNITAGRGFLGVAANIFGGWSVLGSIFASFIFGIAQAIRFLVGGFSVPDQIVQIIPYAVTLIALIIFGNKKSAPKGLGDMS